MKLVNMIVRKVGILDCIADDFSVICNCCSQMKALLLERAIAIDGCTER